MKLNWMENERKKSPSGLLGGKNWEMICKRVEEVGGRNIQKKRCRGIIKKCTERKESIRELKREKEIEREEEKERGMGRVVGLFWWLFL